MNRAKLSERIFEFFCTAILAFIVVSPITGCSWHKFTKKVECGRLADHTPEIKVKLDEMMARRKLRLNELAERVGITEANLSILKNDKAKAIRFSTLEALCRELECQPGDLLTFE